MDSATKNLMGMLQELSGKTQEADDELEKFLELLQ